MENGALDFVLTSSFVGCEIGSRLFRKMIQDVCKIVSQYSDTLMDIYENRLSIVEFLTNSVV